VRVGLEVPAMLLSQSCFRIGQLPFIPPLVPD
jgi:hypothetical protein